MNNIANTPAKQFESLRNLSDEGAEFWSAKELQTVLDYSEWRKFEQAIGKAITDCKTSGYEAEDHFVQLDKMVNVVPVSSVVLKDTII